MRIDDLGGLRHEMDSGENDDLSLRFAGKPCELEGVAPQVGHAVKDVGRHVVVGQHDRVAFHLELVDLVDDRLEKGGFDVGYHPVQTEMHRRGL